MEPRVVFWSAAWLNMLLIVVLGTLSVVRARTGDYERHRRLMIAAGALVVVFVLSYAVKLWFLGREDLASWAPQFVVALRVHELCVALMLIGGVTAAVQALRLGLPGVGEVALGGQHVSRTRIHRRAGWMALLAAGAGIALAAIVLYGMYQERSDSALQRVAHRQSPQAGGTNQPR